MARVRVRVLPAMARAVVRVWVRVKVWVQAMARAVVRVWVRVKVRVQAMARAVVRVWEGLRSGSRPWLRSPSECGVPLQ